MARDLLIALSVAVGLTVVFWSGLWLGGGLIGGDLYPYFFPQRVFYAEQLAEGRIPLWNDRVGFGYPVLGESQTGALYPPNLLAYAVLPVNAAYNVTQIGHYVAGFLAMLVWLRGAGISRVAALFGAGVYVYSWFPPRICLEWAAVGMPYLPLGLWLIDRRAWGWLGVALGMHLLAGHYNLAFIECVVWTVYHVANPESRKNSDRPRWRAFALRHSAFGLSVLLGFALASVQVLDTVALKNASQRADVGDAFSPGYGHIPPLYLAQLAAGWLWYGPELDAAVQAMTPAVTADTNKVESHLYVGLVPLLLAAWQVFAMVRGCGDRRSWTLVGLAAFAAVYATGVLVPVTQHLPGFGYFMGPGRWGIVVTLSLAYLAARGLDAVVATSEVPTNSGNRTLLAGRHSRSLVAAAFAVTLSELWLVSGRVTYAVVVPQAPVDYLGLSPVKQIFDDLSRPAGPPRVYAPGQNVVSMLGVAQWPTYLGLGPAEYWTAMPARPEGVEGMFYSDEQAAWLRENAVGYALSFEALDAERWGLTPLWQGVDPVLNGIWGRGGEPLFLYRIDGAAESAFAAEGHCDPTAAALTDVDWRPGSVAATTEANAFHIRQARLAYGLLHGWVADSRVSCPDNPFAVGVSTNGPGRKTIAYRPGYWFVSLPLTLVAAIGLAATGVRSRRRRRGEPAASAMTRRC